MDSLLAVQDGSISGEEADYLLDLRQLLKGRTDAERTLRAFCELRRRLEQREYLAFYRLRRWLENQVVCHVRASPDGLPMTVPLRLDNYCIEAVRRVCICAAINTGMRLTKPRLTFTFVPRGELLDSAGVSAGREA